MTIRKQSEGNTPYSNFIKSIKQNKPLEAYEYLKAIISTECIIKIDALISFMELCYYSKMNDKVIEIFNIISLLNNNINIYA